MAEQFICMMAELDEGSQKLMSGWHDSLTDTGICDLATPGLPFHITMATFPCDKEQEAAELTRKMAAAFAPVPVHVSHIGMFAGGKVLFGAAERDNRLNALHEATGTDVSGEDGKYVWTPHISLLINEPDNVQAALPVLVKCFRPFTGTVTRLRLCAFWPTREIVSAELTGNR